MLKKIEISGFKSFAKKTTLSFDTPITAIVGPNGSGKSNVVESVRFVLGEQSMKSLRGKGGSDLIWKGSKLLPAGSKARVAITFSNADRRFAFSGSSGASADLGFDEITLAREVASDGGSTYFINNTAVRLKDITDLLNSVNIGASGHHIISQGEADRLLSASARDRRSMIEDALGLKVFQMRIKESERKLEKTAINMKEVQALRRELAPHLTFLAKQVEKIKQTEELRTEFAGLFRTYAEAEGSTLLGSEARYKQEESELRMALADIQKTVSIDPSHTHAPERIEAERLVKEKEQARYAIFREKEELGRAIGRIEGKLDALSVVHQAVGPSTVAAHRVVNLCGELTQAIIEAENAEELTFVRAVLERMRLKVDSFTESLRAPQAPVDNSHLRSAVEAEKAALEERLHAIDERIKQADHAVFEARNALQHVEQKIRETERNSYAGIARIAAVEGSLRECLARLEGLARRRAVLADEIREAQLFTGEVIPEVVEPIEDSPEKMSERDALHRRVERIKMKLEDAGAASGSEVLKEYEDTKDRDAFLVRELADLEASIASLRTLIHELRDTIERTFKEGVEKINHQFGEFFKLMFGGGSAFLSIIVEHKRAREIEEGLIEDVADGLPFEHGIEINVNLPHKKVRDLAMLSGGERSLISIALLFAMSQVNPPPFLVLDETDAALDEANSRKYGDMLSHLSEHSKLIVVTHNRETMSRAQVLYGVTMGIEGASKLLSIKFEEAVLIAK